MGGGGVSEYKIGVNTNWESKIFLSKKWEGLFLVNAFLGLNC